MASKYDKQIAGALRSIAKAGKKYVISRTSPTFNDIQGTPNAATPTTGELTAVVLPRYKGQIFNALDDSIREALIRGKLRTVLAAASGAPFEPGPLDTIVIDGANWEVIGCTPLAPDGTPIIFTIGVIQR